MEDLLIKIKGALYSAIFWIDSLGLAFVSNAYNFMIRAMAGFNYDAITSLVESISKRAYVVVGIFALFRCAVSLINSIVDPNKLSDKKEGFGNILIRIVGTIVLIVVTPMIFKQSRLLQTKVVEENLIPKLLLGTEIYDADCVKGTETEAENLTNCKNDPGEVFKLIVMRAAITPNSACTGSGNCSIAKQAYNTNQLTVSTVSKLIPLYEKIDDGYEFAFNYTPFVLLALGLYITYVLISFTIDIAIRSVELLALEVLSPFFIVTFIDPKMASSGAFKNWVQTCIKTYISLFIKIAIITLMLLLVSELSRTDGIFGKGNWFFKAFMIVAILIFVKKAPKWIGDMIGVNLEGGLGIGKKLAGAAGIGGLIGKASNAAAGAARGAASLVHRNNQNRRAVKKEVRDDLGYKRGIDKKARDSRKDLYKSLGVDGKSMFAKRKALNKKLNEEYKNAGVGKQDSLKKGLASGFTGAIVGGKVGLNAKDIKGALSSGKDAAQKEADYLAMTKKDTKVGNWVRNIPGKVEGAWGNPNQLFDARKTIEDNKNAAFHSGGRYQAGLGENMIAESNGDAAKLFKKYGATTSNEAWLAQYCETNGLDKVRFDSLKNNLSMNADGAVNCTIDGKNVNLRDSLYVKGTGGAETFDKFFANYQSTALNNYNAANAQYNAANAQYAQQSTAYQSAINAQNAVADQAKAISSALKDSLPEALKDINIDSDSMFNIKKAINDLTGALQDDEKRNNISTEDEQKLYQNLKELSKLSQDYDTYGEQAETMKNGLEDIKNDIDSLKPVIDDPELKSVINNIDGASIGEKEQNINKTLSKLDKRLEGIKRPDDK